MQAERRQLLSSSQASGPEAYVALRLVQDPTKWTQLGIHDFSRLDD